MSERGLILHRLIGKAHAINGESITAAVSMAQGEQMAIDLVEIPTDWLERAYEHARVHRKPVPRSIEVIRSWDLDLKAEAFKPKPTKPVAQIAAPEEKTMDTWTEVVTERHLMRQGISLPEASPWVTSTACDTPTLHETIAFCRMIAAESPKGRETLIAYWGTKNPYGLSEADIRSKIPASGNAQEQELAWG